MEFQVSWVGGSKGTRRIDIVLGMNHANPAGGPTGRGKRTSTALAAAAQQIVDGSLQGMHAQVGKPGAGEHGGGLGSGGATSGGKPAMGGKGRISAILAAKASASM